MYVISEIYMQTFKALNIVIFILEIIIMRDDFHFGIDVDSSSLCIIWHHWQQVDYTEALDQLSPAGVYVKLFIYSWSIFCVGNL